MAGYVIVRDDGQPDRIAGGRYASYDEAHAVLERYYGDLCCSDEREYYRIEPEPAVVVENVDIDSATGTTSDSSPAAG